MKKYRLLVAAFGSAALLAFALTGCTININAPETPKNQGIQSGGEFSGADLMFADMMIPHHQQAIEMSTLAETRTSNPEVLALAAEITAAQEPEIDQMQRWLDQAQQPMAGMDHSGHAMGGMLTPEQMQALADASGAMFDRLYLEGMIVHHEGAIQMTRMIENSENPEVRELATDIIRAQTAEIERMKNLLTSL